MPAVGVIEGRRWLPKYRAVIISESGKTLAAKTFFFKKNARNWMQTYTVEKVFTQFT